MKYSILNCTRCSTFYVFNKILIHFFYSILLFYRTVLNIPINFSRITGGMQSGWYRTVVVAIMGLFNLFAIFKFFGNPIEKALQEEELKRGCRYSDGLIEGRVDASMNNKMYGVKVTI